MINLQSYKKFLWNFNNKNILIKILFLLLLIRFISACIYCFMPINAPHNWRQTDTIGVTLSYWIRWNTSSTTPWYIPSVLNSGDTNGVMPMEFPILNIINAPFFYFGPYWGKVLSGLFVSFVVLCLIFVNLKIWKNTIIQGVPVFESILLFSIFSYSAQFLYRFMPDSISIILCLISVGITWNNKKYILPFILSTIGLLMKPTSIIIFVLYLAHKNKLLKLINLIWMLPSIIISYLYYIYGVKYISTYQEMTGLFYVQKRPFFKSIKEFFSQYINVINNLNNYSLFNYGFLFSIIVIFYYFFKEKKIYFYWLWITATVQFIIIAGLDGAHAFVHYYYMAGISPTMSLIAIGIWNLLKSKILKAIAFLIFIKMFISICMLDIFGINLANSIKNLFTVKNNKINNNYIPKNVPNSPGEPAAIRADDSPFKICAKLKERNPDFPWNKGYIFQSTNTYYPSLGLCFGEREASKSSNFGFFYKSLPIPKTCIITDSEETIAIGKCNTN